MNIKILLISLLLALLSVGVLGLRNFADVPLVDKTGASGYTDTKVSVNEESANVLADFSLEELLPLFLIS